MTETTLTDGARSAGEYWSDIARPAHFLDDAASPHSRDGGSRAVDGEIAHLADDGSTALPAPTAPRPERRVHRGLLPRPRGIAAVLVLQVVTAPVVGFLAGTGRPVWQLVLAWAFFPALVGLVRVQGASLPEHYRTWRAWRRRRAHAARLTRGRADGNSLSVLADTVATGSVAGPRSSELGVVTDATGWSCAMEVRESDREADVDWLTRALSLPTCRHPGVRTSLLFQFRAAGHDGPQAVMSAWLVVRVEPVPGSAPGDAVRGLPGVLRSQARDLINAGHDLGLAIDPLGAGELVNGLAVTTELVLDVHPPATSHRRQAGVSENWSRWVAQGRTHRSLCIPRPRRSWDPRNALDIAFACAAAAPNTVLTGSLRLDRQAGESDRPVLVLRVSSRSGPTASAAITQLRRALHAADLRTDRLAGSQGPAVLCTSVLGNRPTR
ncbi:MAG: hypothetical protein ACFCVF_09815 [Kineosporiaceae bacterium]